ncbi:MAG: hypothetical protein LBC49_01325 [Bacteroidales bacterium]|jgi:hypothetical protein|nr:hypothetical protein [Bacteroidales bacterium]
MRILTLFINVCYKSEEVNKDLFEFLYKYYMEMYESIEARYSTYSTIIDNLLEKFIDDIDCNH